MLTLASCATTTGLSGPTDADWSKVSTIVTCQSIKPIHWSSHDTDQTIKEAKAHNAALLAVCPSLRP